MEDTVEEVVFQRYRFATSMGGKCNKAVFEVEIKTTAVGTN